MARKRNREQEEHENHERWLVSYADFITLLFAFFVVMYAISQVNDGKYRAVSRSIVAAFSSSPQSPQAPKPQVTQQDPAVQDAALQQLIALKAAKTEERRRQIRERMRGMTPALMEAFGTLAKDGQVRVTEGAHGITLEINAGLLFAPGEAALNPAAVPVLGAVAQVLAQAEFPLIVEGHTDNIPISNAMFPSNWELSAVRASSVARLFVENGIVPSRVTAAGFADQRPVTANDSPESRSRNRRVAIQIEMPQAEKSISRN